MTKKLRAVNILSCGSIVSSTVSLFIITLEGLSDPVACLIF